MSSRFFSQGYICWRIKKKKKMFSVNPTNGTKNSEVGEINHATLLKFIFLKILIVDLVAFKFKPQKWGGAVLKCQLFFFRVAGMLMWWPLCAVVKRLGWLRDRYGGGGSFFFPSFALPFSANTHLGPMWPWNDMMALQYIYCILCVSH